MDATMLIALISAISIAVGSFIGVLGFWLRFAENISLAKSKSELAKLAAESASALAVESRKLADEAHTRITALDHAFGIYRERVAMDYVSQSSMRDFKAELISAMRDIKTELVSDINKIEGKLDKALAN